MVDNKKLIDLILFFNDPEQYLVKHAITSNMWLLYNSEDLYLLLNELRSRREEEKSLCKD